MDNGVFERYELKYMLAPAQKSALERLLSARMDKDAFGDHTVMSLYYDTPDRRMIGRSMEKPVYKEKLRLRSYGEPGANAKVYVEVKKKYRGVVYKRRCGMSLARAEAFLKGNVAPQTQIEREAAELMTRYPGIEPAMLLCYEREAYFGRGNEASVRVTFDSDIRYRAYALTLADGCDGTPLTKPGEYLMEVKLPGVMPLWLAQALDALSIYPCSFSKYGSAYAVLMTRPDGAIPDKKEMNCCA